MVVCKFFLQGNCRFGDNCRNEHPQSGGSSFGSNNRFGALQNTSNRFGSESNQKREWSIEAPQIEQIRTELTKERPRWILSTYSGVKNTPASLFEGNEYSPEEIRSRFYELASKGQEAQADQEALQLWSKAEQDINNALNSVNDLPKYMDDAEKKHPNRYDFISFDGTKTRDEHSEAVQNTQNTASSSAFGAGSGFGQSPSLASNPFSKPAAATFGQPAGPSSFGNNAFGKPAQESPFAKPAFGAASNPGSATTSGFGQPAAASAFGKPAFGSTSFGQPAFGQASNSTSAFGQTTSAPAFGSSGFGSTTSAFGKTSEPTSAFGQPAVSTAFGQPAQPSAFGQSITSSQPSFGQTGFGQTKSPFGQASQSATGFGQTAFGQAAKPAGGFGQTGFGQTAQPTTSSPFGQAAVSSGMGSNTGDSGAFGQTTQASSNPFGMKPVTNATPEVSMEPETVTPAQQLGTTAANPFSQPPIQAAQAPQPTAALPQPNANSSQTPHPLSGKPPYPLHYTESLPVGPTQIDPQTKRLNIYRGQRIAYISPKNQSDNAEAPSVQTAPPVPCYNRPDGKGPEKVWFPEGGAAPEVLHLGKEDKIGDLQASADQYTSEVKDVYRNLWETGRFEPGKIPNVPPMREWILYDF